MSHGRATLKGRACCRRGFQHGLPASTKRRRVRGQQMPSPRPWNVCEQDEKDKGRQLLEGRSCNVNTGGLSILENTAPCVWKGGHPTRARCSHPADPAYLACQTCQLLLRGGNGRPLRTEKDRMLARAWGGACPKLLPRSNSFSMKRASADPSEAFSNL